MARSSSSFSAAWTAAALLLLLALLATPAARAQAPAPASATDASDVDPAANYTCPVTIDLPETAIPPECSSKEPKDVCQACLTQVVEKVTSQIPETVPCGPEYQKCLGPLMMKLARTPKINLAALVNCDQDGVAQIMASKIKCAGTRPTAEDIKKGMQASG